MFTSTNIPMLVSSFEYHDRTRSMQSLPMKVEPSSRRQLPEGQWLQPGLFGTELENLQQNTGSRTSPSRLEMPAVSISREQNLSAWKNEDKSVIAYSGIPQPTLNLRTFQMRGKRQDRAEQVTAENRRVCTYTTAENPAVVDLLEKEEVIVLLRKKLTETARALRSLKELSFTTISSVDADLSEKPPPLLDQAGSLLISRFDELLRQVEVQSPDCQDTLFCAASGPRGAKSLAARRSLPTRRGGARAWGGLWRQHRSLEDFGWAKGTVGGAEVADRDNGLNPEERRPEGLADDELALDRPAHMRSPLVCSPSSLSF
jgi:hypothetical protein